MASNLAYAVQVEEEESFSAASDAEAAAQVANAPVLLHVRFRPDATVMKIDYCPGDLSAEEWFKRLCASAGDKYATRVGGRGFFRLTPAEIESLKAQRH
jgi:hypothetical protein